MTVSTTVVAQSVSVARAADPATAALAGAMGTLGEVIAAGSSLQQAAEAVPFTGVSPALAGGLDMAQSLQGTLGQLQNNIQNFVDQAPATRRTRWSPSTPRWRASRSPSAVTARATSASSRSR